MLTIDTIPLKSSAKFRVESGNEEKNFDSSFSTFRYPLSTICSLCADDGSGSGGKTY